jgi:hypothetical protein
MSDNENADDAMDLNYQTPEEIENEQIQRIINKIGENEKIMIYRLSLCKFHFSEEDPDQNSAANSMQNLLPRFEQRLILRNAQNEWTTFSPFRQQLIHNLEVLITQTQDPSEKKILLKNGTEEIQARIAEYLQGHPILREEMLMEIIEYREEGSKSSDKKHAVSGSFPPIRLEMLSPNLKKALTSDLKNLNVYKGTIFDLFKVLDQLSLENLNLNDPLNGTS